ncbi:MAG: hypothetical protein ACK5PS_02790 [Desulfopila sp.]
MSERLPNVDNLCTNPANHRMHICELRLAGRKAEIDRLQKNPQFVCGNCGTTASDIGALCLPGPIDSA